MWFYKNGIKFFPNQLETRMTHPLAQKTFPAVSGAKFGASIINLTPSVHPLYMNVEWATECNGKVASRNYLLSYSDPVLTKANLECFPYEGEVIGRNSAAAIIILTLGIKPEKDKVKFSFVSSDGQSLEDEPIVWQKKRGTKTYTTI